MGTFNGWMESIYIQWVNKLVKHNPEAARVIFVITGKSLFTHKTSREKTSREKGRIASW